MGKVFFKECFLTDIIKYDALLVWNDLKIGVKLELDLECDSSLFDSGKKCIFAYLDGKKIGVLTEEDAKMMDQIMNMGWKDLFLCRISQVDNDATNDQRIKVAIYIQECPLPLKISNSVSKEEGKRGKYEFLWEV